MDMKRKLKKGERRTAGKEEGQASSEYLIISAFAIIIATVVIALLSFYPGVSTGNKELQSRIYWGKTTPISITEGSMTGKNELAFSMENKGAEQVRLTRLEINGQAVAFGLSPTNSTNNTIVFGPGEKKLIIAQPSSFECVEGKTASFPIALYYTTSYGTEGEIRGTTDFVVSCRFGGAGGSGGGSGGSGGRNCGDPCTRGEPDCELASLCPASYVIGGDSCPGVVPPTGCCSVGEQCVVGVDCCVGGSECIDGTCQYGSGCIPKDEDCSTAPDSCCSGLVCNKNGICTCTEEGGGCEEGKPDAVPCCPGLRCSGAAGFCMPE
ncbi:MAG: hypothetical protein N3E51_01375 [Candidatus Micrarchaeota archaeon]|nr:hypothetical protein [Candidatus Micrarchaeota archaeon]